MAIKRRELPYEGPPLIGIAAPDKRAARSRYSVGAPNYEIIKLPSRFECERSPEEDPEETCLWCPRSFVRTKGVDFYAELQVKY